MPELVKLPVMSLYRLRLQQRMDMLVAALSKGAAEDAEKRSAGYLGEVRDRGEESAAESEAEVSSAVSVSHSEELARVRKALQRFDDGTYGICEVCGEAIGEARLEANPCARRCIECQSDFERLGT